MVYTGVGKGLVKLSLPLENGLNKATLCIYYDSHIGAIMSHRRTTLKHSGGHIRAQRPHTDQIWMLFVGLPIHRHIGCHLGYISSLWRSCVKIAHSRCLLEYVFHAYHVDTFSSKSSTFIQGQLSIQGGKGFIGLGKISGKEELRSTQFEETEETPKEQY